jgi:hypothetical protein
MPDQDEFDPIGRNWRHAYDLLLGGTSDVDHIANEVLLAVTRMVRRSGGCTVLPDLQRALEDFWIACYSRASLWHDITSDGAYHLLDARLDALAKGVTDRRIEMIAIRSARAVAMQLAQGSLQPKHTTALKQYFGAQIVEHLVCHRALDPARAHAVGLAVSTCEQAHAVHDAVLERLRPALAKVGARLAEDPTGRTVRRLRLVPPPGLDDLLFADEYRFDVAVARQRPVNSDTSHIQETPGREPDEGAPC